MRILNAWKWKDVFKRRKTEHPGETPIFAFSLNTDSLTFNVPLEAHARVVVQSGMTISKVITGQMRTNLEV